ncbi:MAG: biopolymer transporter ExbD [Anaeromyxobacter sp.]
MAGSYDSGDGDDLIGGVNITPIVDVCLTLLIIVIVSAQLGNRSLPIQVPRAATGESAPPAILNVAVDREGQIYLNGERASLEAIPRAVEEGRRRAPDGKLSGFVSADVAAPYGRFAQAVDLLRQAGITEIALDTQPAAEP